MSYEEQKARCFKEYAEAMCTVHILKHISRACNDFYGNSLKEACISKINMISKEGHVFYFAEYQKMYIDI